MKLKGSKTEQNLKDAFAGESQANRRYLYFAQGRRRGLQRRRRRVPLHGRRRDRARARPSRVSRGRRRSRDRPADRRHELEPQGGDRRRDPRVHRHVSGHGEGRAGEGFEEIADWFETLAKAERSHANRFQKALDGLDD